MKDEPKEIPFFILPPSAFILSYVGLVSETETAPPGKRHQGAVETIWHNVVGEPLA